MDDVAEIKQNFIIFNLFTENIILYYLTLFGLKIEISTHIE